MSTDKEAASSSTDTPCRSHNQVLADMLQDDTTQRRLLEAGSELMLQQHLDYNGCLTMREQCRWKQTVTNALSEKSEVLQRHVEILARQTQGALQNKTALTHLFQLRPLGDTQVI